MRMREGRYYFIDAWVVGSVRWIDRVDVLKSDVVDGVCGLSG